MKIVFCAVLLTLAGCGATSSEVARARANGVAVLFNYLDVGAPDYAGGMPVYLGVTNTSDKTIKHLQFEVTPYNQFGEPEVSEIDGEGAKTLMMTRRINPGQTIGSELFGYTKFYPIWYNSHIRCIELNRVGITFLDDSLALIEDANAVLGLGSVRRCRGD